MVQTQLTFHPCNSFFINNQNMTCPYSEFFWSYFLAYKLNTERYSVSLCIQSEYGKIRIRKTPNTDTFHALTAVEKHCFVVLKVNKSVYITKSGKWYDKTLNNFLLHMSNYTLNDMYMLKYILYFHRGANRSY